MSFNPDHRSSAVNALRDQLSAERSVIAHRQLIGRLLRSFENLLRYADRYNELTVIHHHYDDFENKMFEYIFEQLYSNPDPDETETLPFDE